LTCVKAAQQGHGKEGRDFKEAGMKTILLHVTDDEANGARTAFALDLARRFDAHLDCLAVRPDLSLVINDPWGGVLVTGQVQALLDAQRRELRERIERQLAREDVPWTYSERLSDPAGEVVNAARLADAVIIGRSAGMAFVGDVATAARAPVLLAADGVDHFADGPALVAWNGRDEAAAALKGALPLLRLATDVIIIAVAEPGRHKPDDAVCRYLSRHGIDPLFEIVDQGGNPEDALLAAQARHGAPLVVMGAYGHGRLRQFLLGGVTRRMIADCPATLVLAH
jgi:nucleotide-binding universal stress UspA family protein